jgi:anti-sigma factor RsiW
MAIQCNDIETLVHTYLDGELAEHDLLDVEDHLTECEACRQQMDEEARFVSRVREDLAPPPPPPMLHAQLLEALDGEDQRGAALARRTRRAFALPAAASVAAAAALVLFASAQWSANETPVTYEAVKQHLRRPPVEVQGAGVSPWIQQHFLPRVALPRFSEPSVNLVGARLSHLRGRDAAQLFYEVMSSRGHRNFQVHIIDASDLRLGGRDRREVGGRALWVDDQLGFSTVTFRDQDGIGYLFTSDMEADELFELVIGSDLLLRATERPRRR